MSSCHQSDYYHNNLLLIDDLMMFQHFSSVQISGQYFQNKFVFYWEINLKNCRNSLETQRDKVTKRLRDRETQRQTDRQIKIRSWNNFVSPNLYSTFIQFHQMTEQFLLESFQMVFFRTLYELFCPHDQSRFT